MVDEILSYWFGDQANTPEYYDERNRFWFVADPVTDANILERFSGTIEQALNGDLDDWAEGPRGLLALVLVLDQFTRNVYRGTPKAFSGDPRALLLARRAIDDRIDIGLEPVERVFLYLPLEHSEDIGDQEMCLRCHRRLADSVSDALREQYESFYMWAGRHHAVIERFGRFPHRNTILGRKSTPEEAKFLQIEGPF